MLKSAGRLIKDNVIDRFSHKLATVSAVVNGTIAATLSSGHGDLEMIAAGVTGATAGFVLTGVTAGIVQCFSPVKNRLYSYIVGGVVAATTTFGITLGFHEAVGNAEALKLCVAPTTISYTTSYVTNWITRKGYMRPKKYGR